MLFSYILGLIADTLNIKALHPQLPEEFKDIFDSDKYKKSQEYTKVNTRFGLISGTFSLVVTLAFWFAGGFNFLDQFVRSFEFSFIWNGLMFIGLLLLGNFFISLPFGIYSTFVIEEKFGFNKTTVKTFILDIIKGFALSIILGGPILAGILYFFQYTGEYAWLYSWIAAVAFTLIIQYIAPTWIMPLFNKFTPLEEGDLRKSIFSYADKVKFTLKNIFVMDGSKRSSKSNAFFTGFGKNKRIALYDTLIEKHSVAELTAVLAHEIGHYKKKHILKSMIISIIHLGFMFYLLSIFISHSRLAEAFYMETASVYAGLIFFSMLYSPIEMILSIFMQIFSRKNEYEADNFAATTIEDKNEMINALKKLSSDNLSNLTPHPFYVFLHYSHPPVLERIRVIRSLS